MNKENCALKLVDEIILYYDARLKKTSNYETFCYSDKNNKFLVRDFREILNYFRPMNVFFLRMKKLYIFKYIT